MILLATTLRFWMLDKIPSFEHDEAMLAKHTKWVIFDKGELRPIGASIRYGPIFNILSAISFTFFGFTVFAVRFFPAVFGVLTVVVCYLFSRLIFGPNEAVFTGYLVATSPWFVAHSRIGWQASLTPFFVVSGTYFIFYSLKKNDSRFLLVAGILGALAAQCHGYALLIFPIWFFYLLLNRWRWLLSKNFVFMVLLAMIFYTPLYYNLTHDFETFKWFSGSGHFKASKGISIKNTLDHQVGGVRSIYYSLDGRYYLIGFQNIIFEWDLFWAPLLFIFSIMWAVYKIAYKIFKGQFSPELYFIIWFLVFILIIPQVTKGSRYSGDFCGVVDSLLSERVSTCHAMDAQYLDFFYPIPYFLIPVFVLSFLDKVDSKKIFLLVF